MKFDLTSVQGPVEFSGRLESLGQLQAPLTGAPSPEPAESSQHQASGWDDRMASITRRITGGNLEDQPAGMLTEPSFQLAQAGAGPSAVAPGQSPGAGQVFSQQQAAGQPFLLPDILSGWPLRLEPSSPRLGAAGEGHEEAAVLPSSPLRSHRPTSWQQPLSQTLAENVHQGMYQQSPTGLSFPGLQAPAGQGRFLQGTSQQPQGRPPQVPAQANSPSLQQAPQQLPTHLLGASQLREQQLQQLQQQLQQQQQQTGSTFSNDGSSSTSSMNSAQVPQLRSSSVTEGLMRMPSRDVGSSPSGGRAARRGRSHSLGAMPRSSVPSNPSRFGQQAQRDPQHQGQGFPLTPSHHVSSSGQHGSRPGLMRPPRSALRSPSLSPSLSPDKVPALRQALPMLANLGVESGQVPSNPTVHFGAESNPGPSNPTVQFGAESNPGPSNPTVQIGLGAGNPQDHLQQNWANPFQGHASQPWGQSIDPSSVFESQLLLLRQSPQHTAASDTEPGKLESHAYQHKS